MHLGLLAAMQSFMRDSTMRFMVLIKVCWATSCWVGVGASWAVIRLVGIG
jgi:hypothetical protein